jgi:hypothetical protein
MHCVGEASTIFDSGRIVSLTVAMAALNAIPAVREASLGVKSAQRGAGHDPTRRGGQPALAGQDQWGVARGHLLLRRRLLA